MVHEPEVTKQARAVVRTILHAHGVDAEPTEADIEVVEEFGEDRWDSGIGQSQSLLANPPY